MSVTTVNQGEFHYRAIEQLFTEWADSLRSVEPGVRVISDPRDPGYVDYSARVHAQAAQLAEMCRTRGNADAYAAWRLVLRSRNLAEVSRRAAIAWGLTTNPYRAH